MAILHENVSLIECADDVALEELMVATPLSAHVIQKLSPKVVLVDPEYLDNVIQALSNKGYTPRILLQADDGRRADQAPVIQKDRRSR
jgi:hypothetical protein